MKRKQGEMMEHKKLALSVAEAAQMLSLCTKTVRHLIAAKELPARRIGRRVVVRVADLEAFLRRDHAIPRSDAEATEEIEAA
jgi:excisionase family DNA binding protein